MNTKQEMEVMLIKVSDYFKEKLLKGDYKFISCDDYTAEILIDGVYKFSVWISNDQPHNFEFYQSSGTCTIKIGNSMKFETKKERVIAWLKIKPLIFKYKNDILLNKKREELAKLESELNL